MMPIIFSDADNTLWDTDAVYRRAHEWLFNETVGRSERPQRIDDPVSFVRSIDQELAESHPAHLRYPPSLLVNELLRRTSFRDPPEPLVSQLATHFTGMTSESPELRPGVESGLDRLKELHFPVHVITEASLERCMRLLRHHHLDGYVASAESVIKDEAHFTLLKRQLPTGFLGWVVGDQLSRDILPARAAGLNALYYPSSFQPRWETVNAIDPDIVRVSTFASVPTIIEDTRAAVDS